jgi:hypothetical protein
LSPPFALFCRDTEEGTHFATVDELWSYVRENRLCSEDLGNEDLPPRRVLHPGYEIHSYSNEQTFV